MSIIPELVCASCLSLTGPGLVGVSFTKKLGLTTYCRACSSRTFHGPTTLSLPGLASAPVALAHLRDAVLRDQQTRANHEARVLALAEVLSGRAAAHAAGLAEAPAAGAARPAAGGRRAA
jgi:hypothetical protein